MEETKKEFKFYLRLMEEDGSYFDRPSYGAQDFKSIKEIANSLLDEVGWVIYDENNNIIESWRK